jgi:hypothetical protein
MTNLAVSGSNREYLITRILIRNKEGGNILFICSAYLAKHRLKVCEQYSLHALSSFLPKFKSFGYVDFVETTLFCE